MWRCLLIGAGATLLYAEAGIDPALLRCRMQRFQLEPLPAAGEVQTAWSWLDQGLEVAYESIVLTAEELRYRLRQPQDHRQPIPRAVTIQAVDLTCGETSWPGFPVRGRLQADTLQVQEQTPVAGRLQYQIQSLGQQPMTGLLRLSQGWVPVQSDAAAVEALLTVPFQQGFGSPVLRQLRLLPAEESVHLALQQQEWWHARARRLELNGDEAGWQQLQAWEQVRINQDDPTAMTVQIAGHLQLPLRAGGSGQATGGLQLQWAQSRLQADACQWQLAADATPDQPWLQSGRLVGTVVLAFQADDQGSLRQLSVTCESGRLEALPVAADQSHAYHLSLQAVTACQGQLRDTHGQLIPFDLVTAALVGEVHVDGSGTWQVQWIEAQASEQQPMHCSLWHPEWPWRLAGGRLRFETVGDGYRIAGDRQMRVSGLSRDEGPPVP